MTTARMRQVVVSENSIDVVTAEIPQPEEREVAVRSLVTGVCGSDTHAAHGRHPFIQLPYHPGHEVVGVVERVAPGVTTVHPGDRVTVEPDLPCWDCKMCTSGRENLCENLRFFGCGYEQGGMAEYFTIPADRLHRIPDEMTLAQAALVEPLSTPVHAVRLAGDVTGKAVAVLGASAAIDAAAPDVVVQVRQALGESADVVFDCVAIEPTVRQAIGMASKGGTVVIVGVPSAEVSLPLAVVQDHQIRIQGSATYLKPDFDESIELLQTGAVRPEAIITSVLPLDDVATAFSASSSGEEVKVLVTIDEDTRL